MVGQQLTDQAEDRESFICNRNSRSVCFPGLNFALDSGMLHFMNYIFCLLLNISRLGSENMDPMVI